MSRKKKRGVPTLYSESKVKVGVSLTPTGAKRLGDIAKQLGLSRSEFVERIARGEFDVSGSGSETTITLATQAEANTANSVASSEQKSVDPQVESEASQPSQNQDNDRLVKLQERYQNLQSQSEEQANTIKNLEQQLAQTVPAEDYQQLQKQLEKQLETVQSLEQQLTQTVPAEDYQQLQQKLQQQLKQQEATVSELRHQLEHQNVSMAHLEHQLARIPELETKLAPSPTSTTIKSPVGSSLEHSPNEASVHHQLPNMSRHWKINAGLTDLVESFKKLKQKTEEQEQTINSLRQEIIDLRRLATIAESHLGRWRHNTFSR